MATTEIRAMQTCKRCMDIATMRKRRSMGTISRQVCVTSIRILRSGVRRKSHAPIWSSGRRGDPSTDCNSKHINLRTRIKRLVRRTICFSKTERMHDLVIGLFINRYEFGLSL